MIQTVLSAYGFNEGEVSVEAFVGGLINHTWKIVSGNKSFILQRINDRVFKQPRDIAHNIKLISAFLALRHPGYNFVPPVPTIHEEEMVFIQGEGFYRLFPFVKKSHSIDVVETPEQAYEAALQFGRFTHLLAGLDITQLRITIPDFHNLSFRYSQFNEALQQGNAARVKEANEMVRDIKKHESIVETYEKIKTDPAFHLRVTHHDCKISNVLFDEDDKGLCVIDLDTVMPGYFISDIGDMMRTYLSPVSEEEREYDKIVVREDLFKAIVDGYMEEMKVELTRTEKTSIFFAGEFMILMQAIRFLTDHLNNDVYYGAKYEGHNFIRAGNQLRLLNEFSRLRTALTQYK